MPRRIRLISVIIIIFMANILLFTLYKYTQSNYESGIIKINKYIYYIYIYFLSKKKNKIYKYYRLINFILFLLLY